MTEKTIKLCEHMIEQLIDETGEVEMVKHEMPLTEKVADYSMNKYGKLLCFSCQKEVKPLEKFQPKETTFKEKEDWRDDIINFETLLNEAHAKFKEGFDVKTRIIEHNSEKKYAVLKADPSFLQENKP